ncbi:hypothetical protein GCK72_001561 [Caenorhabditis remanei]|uniref:C2H2-type domain-containing protein n=1 Tax=Caenorhabditis remanei TaxID=31234 RepID=A0A6A5HT07_CAERE|nr:hypothetical protein GCK72_001561 [Caenorhabditis remanei]KAF1769744.1 hypothetical protein GCK72_001561 [Caenorhabditis remanei]
MDDDAEQDILGRMSMTSFEEKLFGLVERSPIDTREMCPICRRMFPSVHHRAWHQFVHLESYTGFLDKNYGTGDLPFFNFFVPCPNSDCSLKFIDFTDAKIHYLLEHQCCQLFCCGIRFPEYSMALHHLVEAENMEARASYRRHKHVINLQPLYVCKCCEKVWSSRMEYTSHLQGKHNMCPDPMCKHLFDDNEKTITHFFEHHYKHLWMDGRHILLNYNIFLKYDKTQEERSIGIYHCEHCYRRFKQRSDLQDHVEANICVATDRKIFSPAIPCKCGYQFVYCYHQRDILLRYLPIFREALEHIAREAPYSEMPEDVIQIYHTMLRVLADVNYRLNNEKYWHYQRTNSSKHSSKFSPRQISKILIGVVEYFVKIM